ncbi:MAG: glycerophosphodiester phosphodiesterase family protein [Rikenellaceae bacterium]
MKRFHIYLLLLIATLSGCSSQKGTLAEGENRAAQIVAEINNPKSDYVLVISHRGDWRNYPENSIKAIESVIDMKVDIVEIDVQLTQDSVLVLCHDTTIDRTTTGTGKVSEVTFDYIRSCTLRSAHGVVTDHIMPTLEEALIVCKDRVAVNIDKGYEYYDLALEITERLGVTDQIIIKGKRDADVVAQKYSEHPNNMIYMPVIDILKPQGKQLFEESITPEHLPVAFELCWDQMTPEVEQTMKRIVESGSKLWVNTLWASLCGGLCDDAAWEANDVEGIYGTVVDFGTTMIQTDRPDMLIEYLRKRGLHE